MNTNEENLSEKIGKAMEKVHQLKGALKDGILHLLFLGQLLGALQMFII